MRLGRGVNIAPFSVRFEQLDAAAEMAGVDIMTGCTRGMCGTDAHRIDAPSGALENAEEDERGTLDRMGVGDDCRLLCCAKVRSGKISVVGDALTD